MRTPLIALALAVVALSNWGSLAEAQTMTDPPTASRMPRVNLTAEQRHIIKEIVLKDLTVPKTTATAPISIGSAVPDSVDLRSFPPEIGQKVPQIKTHQFFVKDDSIIIVTTKDRTIAEVVE